MQKEFVTLKLSDIHPYQNNPRINDDAVDDVMESIKQCENLDPIEIDEDNVVLAGHTRLKALQKLKYKETECIRYSGLTEDQKRKYRILSNRTGEKAEWDFDKLKEELESLDFGDFDLGFEFDEEEEPKEIDENPFDDIEKEEIHYGVPYQGNKSRIADVICHILPEGGETCRSVWWWRCNNSLCHAQGQMGKVSVQ